jgi:hypothetical protein
MAKKPRYYNTALSSVEVINVDTETLIKRRSCKNALSSMGKAAVSSGMAQAKKMSPAQKKIFKALDAKRMQLRNRYYRVCVQGKK